MTLLPDRQFHQKGARLADLIAQLRRLSRNPGVIPLRLQLCRVALGQVRREGHPKLWAELHSEMGLCLMHSPAGAPADNLEQAIEHYEQALEEYTPDAYFEEWVAAMHNLAVIYTRRICGDRTGNQEKAIALHKEIKTCALDTCPAAWSLSHYELGRLYAKRIKGDRAENIERAICHCRQALKVWTGDSSAGWIKTQDLLATLYRCRLLGDPAKNLERSLACLQTALDKLESGKQARTRDWAQVHHNLGATLLRRVRGSRADNLEKAIVHLEKALRVRTRGAFPAEWAETRHNLAVTYIERQHENRAENIEQAIEILKAVLEVRLREKFPVEWAMTQNVLGIAWLKRIHGERVENLEQAIKHLEKALQEQEQVGPAEQKASTQHNLAIAYGERLLGARISNLEKAARHGKAALQALDRRALIEWAAIKTDLVDILWKLANLKRWQNKEQAAAIMEEAIVHGQKVLLAFEGQPPSHRWALAHYNLGNAYSDRIRGDRADNQESAIEHYCRALDFYNAQNFPDRWADAHNNLGVTYWERICDDRATNQEKAAHHFDKALEICRPDTLPVNARRAASNRGRLYFEKREWAQAHESFAVALEAAEALYLASATEAGKQAELAVNATLYAHNAYCLARRKRYTEAVLTLEHGKARIMGEALARDRAQLKQVPPEDRDAFERARACLKALEAEQRAPEPSRPFTRVAAELRAARAGLQDVAHRIRERQPDFMPATPDLTTIAAAARPGRLLVYLTTTAQGSLAAIVPAGADKLTGDHLVWLDRFNEADLVGLLVERDGATVTGGILAGQLSGDAQVLEPALDRTLNAIGERLMAPLGQRLRDLGISAITLIPGGRLSLLPLHAARYGGGYFVDEFQVTYAPSARTLAHCRDRLAAIHAPRPTLFAVGNPLPVFSPLLSARDEAETTASFFMDGAPRLFLEEEATYPRVFEALAERANSGHTYLHFACHGVFEPDAPLVSGLLLGGEKRLTLADLLDRVVLNHTRLAVLSACQTAIIDFDHVPDEAIGLPAGFLTAGVPGVIGSLWPVNDVSTALLMKHFYGYHCQEGLEPGAALRKAQRWMRCSLTLGQVTTYLDRLLAQTPRNDIKQRIRLKAVRTSLMEKHNSNLQARPFASPYYWAPFTMSGT